MRAWNLKEANKFPYSGHSTTKFNFQTFFIEKASSFVFFLLSNFPKMTSNNRSLCSKKQEKTDLHCLIDVTPVRSCKAMKMKSQKKLQRVETHLALAKIITRKIA